MSMTPIKGKLERQGSQDPERVFEFGRSSSIEGDLSTEAGYRSQYGNMTRGIPRGTTSFLSSVDYTSFLDKQPGLSPEAMERT